MVEASWRGGLTISDLVGEESFGLAIVAATPESLHRPITWVHVTEVADPRPHIREGELVCTVGAALVDPHEAVRFVESVADAACAGICLGLGEVHTEVPEALEEACQRRGIALLSMAHGVPFRALSDRLLEDRLRVPAEFDPVSRAMELLRSGSTVTDMLRLGGEDFSGRLEIVTRSSALGDSDHRGRASIEVDIDDDERLRWQGTGIPPDSALLARFARVVHIARRNERVSESNTRRRIGQLMTLVVEGLAQPAALLPDLHRGGVDPDQLVLSAWPEGTGGLLSRLHSTAVIGETASDVLVITPDGRQASDVSKQVQLVFGYSSSLPLADLALGIGEARATLMLARRRGTIAGPETLATLAALLEQQPRSRLAPFVGQLVRPLVTTRVRGGAELLDTLREFVSHHGSVSATADALFVHPNTVRHRLARIREIVGRDPLLDDDRIDLGIAVWAYDRAGRRTETPAL